MNLFKDIHDSALNHDNTQSHSALGNSLRIPISAMSEFDDAPASNYPYFGTLWHSLAQVGLV